jgi:hypothetical protein
MQAKAANDINSGVIAGIRRAPGRQGNVGGADRHGTLIFI